MIRLWVVMLAALALFGCGQERAVKVGLIGGLTGATADLGVASRNGMLLAIEEWNAKGGINGVPIEYVVVDDQQNVEAAQRGINSLIEQQVDFILGPFTSSMAAVIAPAVNQANIPVFATTVTSTEFTGKQDVFFRLVSDTQVLTTNYGGWIVEQYKPTSVIIVVDKSNLSFGDSWEENFREVFLRSNILVRDTLYFTSGNTAELMSVVEQLAQQTNSLVALVSNAVDTALMVRLIKENNPDQMITTSEWAGSSDQFLQVAGIHAENVLVPRFIDLENTESAFRLFADNYSQRFQQPVSYASMLAYEATEIMLTLVQQKGRGEKLMTAISSPSLHTTSMNIYQLDAFGDEISNAVHIATQVVNQQYKTLTDLSK